MANITAALVKELRERTNAGMMDCKKALVESDGDMDKAIDWLREKGLAQAAKKAGRIAAEGAVVAYMTPCGCTGALVEVNCETDFVANTDNFKNFANAVAKHVALANPADLDELMKQKFVDDESKTIEDMVSDATVAIGEKITVRRFARYETEGVVSSYIHMGGKVGVMVEVATDEVGKNSDLVKEFAHDCACRLRLPSRKLSAAKKWMPTSWRRKPKFSARRRLNPASPKRSLTASSRVRSKSTTRKCACLTSSSSRMATRPSPL